MSHGLHDAYITFKVRKNKIGNTRDLIKKITDTKGMFHAKMGTIKDRNGMNLKKSRRY